MIALRTLDDLGDVSGKTVVVRTDFNVPIAHGEVTSNFRIQKTLKTIRELTSKGARVVIITHLGRPEGEYSDELSLMPVRFELGKLLDQHIKFAHIQSCKNSIIFMENGEVLLLENIRFNPGEENANAEERKQYVQELAGLADYFVNDAFAMYRQHASVFELPQMAKNPPVAGRLMEEEIAKLTQLRENYSSPYVAVIGGVKLDTKIDILQDLVTKADTILLGGAMAYTFLKAQGIAVGNSFVEDDKLDTAREILQKAAENDCEVLLPIDHLAGTAMEETTEKVEVTTQQIPDGLVGLDIGERTLSNYLEVIKSAKTIMWNGPMGLFEWDKFSRGTEAVGEYIALSASDDAFKVAGGGDTIAAMERLKVNFKNFDHVSTGGGAMLSFLAGEEFPTLKLLQK